MRAFAYRLLGRREYSEFELVQRMRLKWPGAQGTQELVEALVDENLVSDERFTDSFVRVRLQRLQGPMKIKAALRSKGVSDALISSRLYDSGIDWKDLASQWLERQQAGEISFDEKKKYYRRLVNRGFAHDQAMDALNQ
jgi:regulatory protein